MKHKIMAFFASREPAKLLFIGYISYVILGWLLLSIPLFSMLPVSVLDNLFITVSALSTTGLTTVSVYDSYNFLGQLIIVILIQMGGLGYMTFGSFILLSTKKEISETRQSILETSFSMPKDFKIKKFIISVVGYTLTVEFIGAVFLFFIFLHDNRANPFWSAIFHSISSFCTAGFSLYNNSFENYANDMALNMVVCVLSILGAIGYIVMVDVWLLIRGKKERITFTSKVILNMTFWLLFIGTILFFFNEHNFSNQLKPEELLHSFFQSMTALTTVGFNTVPIGQITRASLLLLNVLMVIGASPSGTGGGVKSTTISCLVGVLKTVLSKHKEVIHYYKKAVPQEKIRSEKSKNTMVKLLKKIIKKKTVSEQTEEQIGLQDEDENNDLRLVLGDIIKIKLMNKVIPYERIIYAICTFSFYIFILVIGFFMLLLTENLNFQDLLFESASAIGTVGLSRGITGLLTFFGKIIIIILMFIGRIGPITFGMALFYRNREKESFEDIVV